MAGMRLLASPILFAALLCTACAGPTRADVDGWGVERRFNGRAPALLSISDINSATLPAHGAIESVRVRARERGRHRIVIAAEKSRSKDWTPGAVLFDPQLDRALDRLATLGASEPRDVELRLTLMPTTGARQQQALHAADRTLVIDLLVPVPAQPRSRSAVLDAALATGLHEAAHALRPAHARDRSDDEYRASLVAACFRIDGAQRGDAIVFNVGKAQVQSDFTRTHSAAAAQTVQRDLAAALGKPTLEGGNRDGLARLQAFCIRRLAQAPR